jgi:hypothetical protein
LRETGCLAVSFCVEIYTLGVVLVRILNPSAPVVGVLNFFLMEIQQFSSDRGMLEMLHLAGFLLW